MVDRNFIALHQVLSKIDNARNEISVAEFEGFDAFLLMKQPYQWEIQLRSGHFTSDSLLVDAKACMSKSGLDEEERLYELRNFLFGSQSKSEWSLFLRMSGVIDDQTFKARIFLQDKNKRHARINIYIPEPIAVPQIAQANFWANKHELQLSENLRPNKKFVPGSLLVDSI